MKNVHSGKILLADDEPAVLHLLGEMLSKFGYDCMLARDGQEVIAMARDFEPDLVIVDVYMPSVNGLDLLKEIPEILPETEIVAISGYASDSTKRKIESLGAFRFLQKPIDMKAFMSVVAEGLSSNRLKRLHISGPTPEILQKKASILVVDDDRAFCDFVKAVLEKEKYQVVVSDNFSAEEKVLEQNFDIALVALGSSGSNLGVKSLRAIRRCLPDIVAGAFVSGKTSGAFALANRECVHAVIAKPATEELLRKKVLSLLIAQKKKSSRSLKCVEKEEVGPGMITAGDGYRSGASFFKSLAIWFFIVGGLSIVLLALYFYFYK